MKFPVVSVIMSVYKEPKEWLIKSIDSILSQSFSNFEFIIVNDNPGDFQVASILSYYQNKDPRIIILSNDFNLGLTKSLNKGIALSKGQFIARMDADDISYPDRFQKQLDFFNSNPDVLVCGTSYRIFNEKGIVNLVHLKSEDYTYKILIKNYFCHPTLMFRNSLLNYFHQIYDEEFKFSQDYALILKVLRYGKACNIEDVLLDYRISERQISKSKIKAQFKYFHLARVEYFQGFLKNNELNLSFNDFKIYIWFLLLNSSISIFLYFSFLFSVLVLDYNLIKGSKIFIKHRSLFNE